MKPCGDLPPLERRQLRAERLPGNGFVSREILERGFLRPIGLTNSSVLSFPRDNNSLL